MEKIDLAGLDLPVSRIGLGTWAIGGWMWGGTDEKESIATIRTALDRGINLIDTAPVYGFGVSERIVGKALQEYGHREEICLVTKVGLEWNHKKEVIRNSSKERIYQEIDDSLERLQTDYIDLYLVHWPDPVVPFAETAEALRDLYGQRKIRAIGVSNYTPEQMDEFIKVTELNACEPPYNLFEKSIEKDVLPYCRNNDISVLAYGALCRGLLSGKMSVEREFHGDDLRQNDPKFQQPRFSRYLKAVKQLDEYAQTHYDKRVLHLAIRWILDQGVHIALWGARRPNQLELVAEIFNWTLDEQARREIEDVIEHTVGDTENPDFGPPTREETS